MQQDVNMSAAGLDCQSAREILYAIVIAPFVIGGVAQSLLHFRVGTPDPTEASAGCRWTLPWSAGVFVVPFPPIAAIETPSPIGVEDVDILIVILSPKGMATDEIFLSHPYGFAGIQWTTEAIKITRRGGGEGAVNPIGADGGSWRRRVCGERRICGKGRACGARCSCGAGRGCGDEGGGWRGAWCGCGARRPGGDEGGGGARGGGGRVEGGRRFWVAPTVEEENAGNDQRQSQDADQVREDGLEYGRSGGACCGHSW